MFTQPANNSVQGPRPHSIHHTHDQVEGDEMSLSIATHFGGLNESHSLRSSKANGLCRAAATQIPAGKERLSWTLSSPAAATKLLSAQPSSPFFNCPKAERLQSVTRSEPRPSEEIRTVHTGLRSVAGPVWRHAPVFMWANLQYMLHTAGFGGLQFAVSSPGVCAAIRCMSDEGRERTSGLRCETWCRLNRVHRNSPRMETLLRNSSYIFLFRSVLPCRTGEDKAQSFVLVGDAQNCRRLEKSLEHFLRESQMMRFPTFMETPLVSVQYD